MIDVAKLVGSPGRSPIVRCSSRHTMKSWLAAHLAALRAGAVTLAQLP
jgi:hypothetical protein